MPGYPRKLGAQLIARFLRQAPLCHVLNRSKAFPTSIPVNYNLADDANVLYVAVAGENADLVFRVFVAFAYGADLPGK